MPSPKAEVLQGTPGLRKTLDAWGPLDGFAIAQRIQQVSENVLRLKRGTKFYSFTRRGRKPLRDQAAVWNQMSAVVNRLPKATS